MHAALARDSDALSLGVCASEPLRVLRKAAEFEDVTFQLSHKTEVNKNLNNII